MGVRGPPIPCCRFSRGVFSCRVPVYRDLVIPILAQEQEGRPPVQVDRSITANGDQLMMTCRPRCSATSGNKADALPMDGPLPQTSPKAQRSISGQCSFQKAEVGAQEDKPDVTFPGMHAQGNRAMMDS